MSSPLNLSPLGHKSVYIDHYDPTLLFPIPRKTKRDELNLPSDLPFSGWDIWNAFELSWLTPKGKPMVAIAVFQIPCTSPNIIESKSFKLYLNSFNQSKIEDTHALLDLLNQALVKMDVVTREEFDVQVQVLEKTRAKIELLEERLAAMHSKEAKQDDGDSAHS